MPDYGAMIKLTLVSGMFVRIVDDKADRASCVKIVDIASKWKILSYKHLILWRRSVFLYSLYDICQVICFFNLVKFPRIFPQDFKLSPSSHIIIINLHSKNSILKIRLIIIKLIYYIYYQFIKSQYYLFLFFTRIFYFFIFFKNYLLHRQCPYRYVSIS